MTYSTHDHRRDVLGLKHVYPVLSRRSGGLSIGINLNPNKACNWRCIYCQVEGLRPGNAPEIDLALLDSELSQVLRALGDGTLAQQLGVAATPLRDFAISGDGEPTSAAEFPEVIELVASLRRAAALESQSAFVLITNGSFMASERVQRGLRILARHGGEVWFKQDRGTAAALRAVNSVAMDLEERLKLLAAAAKLVPTRIQSAWFTLDGQWPTPDEVDAWLDWLRAALARGVDLAGVQIYGLARPSHQPEAPRLGAVSEEWLNALAARVRALDLDVTVNP
jgi:wyosine [tRNA(Phe)-imidazoG37] synthetase (radical SAM superfamily)